MGANVDLQLLTTQYVGVTPVIQLLSKFNYDVYVHEILTIDDWQWNGKKSIDVATSSKDLQDFVLARKIVLIYLQTKEDNPQWQGGCILHQIDGNLFQTSLFLNTAHHESFFGSDLITKRNRIFFDAVTDGIIALTLKSSLVLAGMGIEISINSPQKIINAISLSTNVTRWVAQERLPLPLEYYVEQRIDSVYVYTITNEEEKISYISHIEGF